METVIITAIVTTGASTLTAIGTTLYAARANKKLNQAKSESLKIVDIANKRIQEISGFNIGRNYVKVYMQDLEGTCKIIRGWEGVKANPDSIVDFIPGLAQFDTPGSKIIYPLNLVRPIPFPKPVTFTGKMRGDQRCNFKVEIQGGLYEGDPELSFEVEYTVSHTFLMTAEEAAEAYPDEPFEAFGLRGDLPTKKLDIEIFFPDGFAVDAFPRVTVGEYSFIATRELQRVQSGFSKSAKGARFIVEDPLGVCGYQIQWNPPAKKSVDRKNEKE